MQNLEVTEQLKIVCFFVWKILDDASKALYLWSLSLCQGVPVRGGDAEQEPRGHPAQLDSPPHQSIKQQAHQQQQIPMYTFRLGLLSTATTTSPTCVCQHCVPPHLFSRISPRQQLLALKFSLTVFDVATTTTTTKKRLHNNLAYTCKYKQLLYMIFNAPQFYPRTMACVTFTKKEREGGKYFLP